MRAYQSTPIEMDDGTVVTPDGDGGYSWTDSDGTSDGTD